MKFAEALKEMKKGIPMKLPSWGGYWCWDEEKKTILMHCRQKDSDQEGEILDIRETQRVDYTLLNVTSDEWIPADEKNCPVLGGEAIFSFGDAMKYLKRGLKVARKEWRDRKQYIQITTGITYQNAVGDMVKHEHDAAGNIEIVLVNPVSIRMGWIASQADILADDWMFVE